MSRSIFATAVLLLSLFSSEAYSQSTLIYSSHEVTNLSAMQDLWEAKVRPVLQALEDEGKINGFCRHSHLWGDSYNHNTWWAVDDLSAYEEAYALFLEQYSASLTEEEAAFARANRIGHHDQVYTISDSYSAEGEKSGHVMLNYNQVSDTETWLSAWRSSFVPIMKGLVDSGEVVSFGLLRHDLGDQYNMNYWVGTTDAASFRAAWRKLRTELRANHMDAFQQMKSTTIRHKDNLLQAH